MCREIWEGKTVFIPGFADFKFSVEKETLAKLSNSDSNIEYSKKISRTFMKGGDHKGSEYIYPVNWVSPKGEKILGNILINGEISIGTIYCDSTERRDGTWLTFRDPFQELNTIPLRDNNFEIDSVQYILIESGISQRRAITVFGKGNEASIISVGKRTYLYQENDKQQKLVIQLLLKNSTWDSTEVIKTNHRSVVFYTNSSLESNKVDLNYRMSEIDFFEENIDALFVWGYKGMMENLRQIELQECQIDNLRKGNVLAMTGNGDSHSIFFEKQNALGLHAEKAGGILYVHRCAKTLVEIVNLSFCTDEVPVQVVIDSTKVIQFMDYFKMYGLFRPTCT